MSKSPISDLSDQQLLRYSRQIMLPKFDVAGQLSLLSSRVLLVGLGGLGSPVALYLASAGVGELVLCDHDEVELSNLQRQIIHRQESLGQTKVASAAAGIRAQNPEVSIECIDRKLVGDELASLVAGVDVVVDCTDNFDTRFDINRACIAHRVPLVSGAAIRMEGQVSVFDPRQSDSPCYQCLYSPVGQEELTCSESGVLSPVVGIIGTMQALEAIKVLSGLGTTLAGRVLIFDAMHSSWRELKLKRDPNCEVCGSR